MKTRSQPAASATAGKRLTPQGLVADFGIRSELARGSVCVFYDVLAAAGRDLVCGNTLVEWRRRFGHVAGSDLDQFSQYAPTLARRYGVPTSALNPAALWFALQTYYAAVVRLLVRRFVSWDVDDLPDGNPFQWCFAADVPTVVPQIERLADVMAAYDAASFSASVYGPAETAPEGDLLKALYQNLFPRRLRHRLGEYYTPDWLARHVLDQVGFSGDPGQRLLDPACGSGTFLVLALQRMRVAGRGTGEGELGIRDWELGISGSNPTNGDTSRTASDPVASPSFPVPCPQPSALFPVVGCDLNPLAVLTARANYVIAIHDLLPKDRRVEIPVYLADSILAPPWQPAFAEPFDFVVGNPPWIAWDHLSDQYRQASRPLWQQYGLFSLSGSDARHGGGKKDLAMLMLYTAADRYLKPGGRLGMVITQTLFQTKGAGDGFRHFRLGIDGEPLKVLRVDDMVALRPFHDAANWTSTIILQKGAATEYPVPYFKWAEGQNAGDGGRGTGDGNGTAEGGGRKAEGVETQSLERGERESQQQACWARPMDPARPSSPWLVLPRDVHVGSSSEGSSAASLGGPSDYTAHLGANSGGANGVYWLEVLGVAEGGARVRNMAAKSKQRIETVEQVIEPDLLYPLVRWSDVRRCSAVPGCHILLVQDVVSRTGIAEAVMRARYPRTLAYLERFRELLTARAAYRRYQHSGPFYSMYNVGPYTVAPIKVVWRRMDRRINAAVLENTADPVLGCRPVVPQETCVLVACDSADEAHYLCALLNSDPINQWVAAHSVRNGKGFGTPSMLESLGLRRFQPDNPHHQELATASRRAHTASAAGG